MSESDLVSLLSSQLLVASTVFERVRVMLDVSGLHNIGKRERQSLMKAKYLLVKLTRLFDNQVPANRFSLVAVYVAVLGIGLALTWMLF